MRSGVSLVHMDIRDEAIGASLCGLQAGRRQPSRRAALGRDLGARSDLRRASQRRRAAQRVRETRRAAAPARSSSRRAARRSGRPTLCRSPTPTPQHPTSPYGITKMVGEHYLRFYRADKGLDFTALRYGNVYGPRQDPERRGRRHRDFHRHVSRAPRRAHRLGRRTDARLRLRRRRRRRKRRGAGARIGRVLRDRYRHSDERQRRSIARWSTSADFEAPIERAPQRPATRATRSSMRRERAPSSAGRPTTPLARRNSRDVRILSKVTGAASAITLVSTAMERFARRRSGSRRIRRSSRRSRCSPSTFASSTTTISSAAARFFSGNPFAARDRRTLSLGGRTIVEVARRV